MLHFLRAKGEIKNLKDRKISLVSGSWSPRIRVRIYISIDERRQNLMTEYLDVLKDTRRSDAFGDTDYFPLNLPSR